MSTQIPEDDTVGVVPSKETRDAIDRWWVESGLLIKEGSRARMALYVAVERLKRNAVREHQREEEPE